MDNLLWRVCDELQLSSARYDQAVARYEAVCQWLEADDSALASFRPSMYPQGSMRIGTTVKPLGREEHDLDFVCEFRVQPATFESPLQLLRLVEVRLRQHKSYAPILEVKNRCVRLNYANEFHMDILPACPDRASGGTCVVVPDRQSRWWKPSNPKGYAEWFEKRCELVIEILMAERASVFAKAEPIPDQEATAEKATLKRAVQLLKRWRDVRYQKSSEVAPISMVLTTLAAQTYRGERSVSDALSNILDKMVALTETCKPRIVVLNPANDQEDLSERWDDPVQYAAFVQGIRELRAAWTEAMSTSGIHHVGKLLEGIFGEPVTHAVRKQAVQVQDLRARSALRASSTGALAVTPSLGTLSRPHTFHGE
jgi:hypothetical protein